MIDVRQQLTISQIKDLLDSYSFDTNQCNIECLIYEWLKDYKIEWVYLATIEALFLGRYKVVSIKQILTIWGRLGSPKTHFSGDFERFIGRDLPKHSAAKSIADIDELEPQEEEIMPQPNIASDEIISEEVNSSQQTPLNKLIQDNFPATKISQPKNYSPLQPQDEFNFVPAISILKQYQENLEDNTLSPYNGIKSFTPNPDFSKFFQKLKSFADNQNK